MDVFTSNWKNSENYLERNRGRVRDHAHLPCLITFGSAESRSSRELLNFSGVTV